MVLDGLVAGIGDVVGDIKDFVAEKPLATAAIGAGAVGAVALGAVAISKTRKKSKKKSKSTTRKKTKKKSKGRKLKFGSPAWRKKYIKKGKRKIKPRYARTAGKGKDTSTKRIRMTKNGQPYVILKSGKARFIKKSSAKGSRKLKGGRY